MERAGIWEVPPFFLCRNSHYFYLFYHLPFGWVDVAIILLIVLGSNIVQPQILVTPLRILHIHTLFSIGIVTSLYVMLSALNDGVSAFMGADTTNDLESLSYIMMVKGSSFLSVIAYRPSRNLWWWLTLPPPTLFSSSLTLTLVRYLVESPP